MHTHFLPIMSHNERAALVSMQVTNRGLETTCSAVPHQGLLNCYFHEQILKINNLVKRLLKWFLRKAHLPDNLRQFALTTRHVGEKNKTKQKTLALSQLTTYDLDHRFSVMFT